MVRFYFARVCSHALTFAALPVVWWYWPKVLLVVIHVNTAAVSWIIHAGITTIPDPQVKRYAELAMKPGEWFSSALSNGLMLVPVSYRSQVEVLARVRYEPGGWMLVAECAAVFLIAWRLLRRRKKRTRSP